jgi:hypothetical protein
MSFSRRSNSRAAVPGAVIVIQTFGDFLESNPNRHVFSADG